MRRFFNWLLEFGSPYKSGRSVFGTVMRFAALGTPALAIISGGFIGIRYLTIQFPAFFNVLGWIVGAVILSSVLGALLYIVLDHIFNE